MVPNLGNQPVPNWEILQLARNVDFTVVFPTEERATTFSSKFRSLGLSTKVTDSQCVPDLPWDVTVVKNMVPTNAEITSFERQLQEAAQPLGGRNDGWGCFEANHV